MPQVELILAIGRYAQLYHFRRLGRALPAGMKLEDLVRAWRDHLGDRPRVFALPHPSWRNSGWLKKNPWFEAEVLPEVRREVAELIAAPGAALRAGEEPGRRAGSFRIGAPEPGRAPTRSQE